MCLGIPGKVLSVEHGDLPRARIDFGGIIKDACLAFVPQAEPGDYVIVHAGFAISRIDEAEARRVFEELDRMEELAEYKEPRR
jgi:hydrogenase expression/formation protein HypC